MKIKNKKLFIFKMIVSILFILVLILDHMHVISYVTSTVIKAFILVLYLLTPQNFGEKKEKKI